MDLVMCDSLNKTNDKTGNITDYETSKLLSKVKTKLRFMIADYNTKSLIDLICLFRYANNSFNLYRTRGFYMVLLDIERFNGGGFNSILNPINFNRITDEINLFLSEADNDLEMLKLVKQIDELQI